MNLQSLQIGLNDKFGHKDLKKIGEVYSSRHQNQCFFICTICAVHSDNVLDKAFVASDVFTFWNHMHQEHIVTSASLFGKECSAITEYTKWMNGFSSNSDCNREVAYSTDSNNMESIRIPSVETSLEGGLENSRKAPNELLYATQYKHETELQINDANLSDSESHGTNGLALKVYDDQTVQINEDVHVIDTESHEINGEAMDCHDDAETVEISEDEGDPNSFHGLCHTDIEVTDTIELSDDEGDVTTAEKDSIFTSGSDDIYTCKTCCQMYLNRNEMLEHMKTHQIPVSETSLNDEVNHSNNLQTPVEYPSHTTNANKEHIQNYRCKYCQMTFCTILLLEKHQRIHFSTAESQRHRKSRKEHQQHMHNSEATECVICRNMILESDMALHMRREHNNLSNHPMLTDLLISEIGISQDTPLPSHTKGLRPYKCVLCGKRTGSVKSMIVHHRRFHSDESDSRTTRCGICQKLILSSNMRLHVSSVHGRLGKFSCKTCYLSFKSRTSLQDHMQQFHFEQECHLSQTDDDVPSSSCSSTQVELTPEERAYLFQLFTKHSNSQREMIESLNGDNSDDDVIMYGEIIPPVNIITSKS